MLKLSNFAGMNDSQVIDRLNKHYHIPEEETNKFEVLISYEDNSARAKFGSHEAYFLLKEKDSHKLYEVIYENLEKDFSDCKLHWFPTVVHF